LIDFTGLKAYCYPDVDLWVIQARDVSLVDVAVIPVMVKNAGLTIIFKQVVRRDRNESRNNKPVFGQIC